MLLPRGRSFLIFSMSGWMSLKTPPRSRPSTLPNVQISKERLLDSTSALEIASVPKTMLVVGGGYIGLELGRVYAALGTEVSVVEMLDGLLMGAGDALVTVALPETTLGVATCYDLRFPELFRGLVDAGAETLVIPAGWPERRRSHWTLLARARAVENQSFVLACGTAGTHAGVPQAGHSIVVDPWGEVLAEAGPGEEILTVEFDPAKVAKTRDQFPALKDRVLGLNPPAR